jgi:ABC-type Zn uptake system ZnuABC Zn-binding protein ZnuA
MSHKLLQIKKDARYQITLAMLLMLNVTAFAQPKPLVVATTSIFADMTMNIGGDAVEVKSMVPIGGDPHIYEPTPDDLQLLASANLILQNGLALENWLNERIVPTKAKVTSLTQGVDVLKSLQSPDSPDPHAWLDARQGLIYIENIKNALIELVPDQREMFEFNYQIYRQQLQEMDAYIQTQINTIPEPQRLLVTSHDAFRYYARRYGIRVEALLGISTDANVQNSDLVRLNKAIRKSAALAIFMETSVNPKQIQQLAADHKVFISGKLYSDSIGDKDSPAPSYLDLLKYNTDIIVKAWNKTNAEVQKFPARRLNVTVFIILIGLLVAGGFLLIFRKLKR